MTTTSTLPETNNNGRPLAEPVNYFEMDTKELTDSLEKRFNLSSSDQLNDKPRIVNGTPLKSALRNSNSKTKQRMDEKQLKGLLTEGHDEASVAYTRSLKSSETGVESRLSYPNLAAYLGVDEEQLRDRLKEMRLKEMKAELGVGGKPERKKSKKSSKEVQSNKVRWKMDQGEEDGNESVGSAKSSDSSMSRSSLMRLMADALKVSKTPSDAAKYLLKAEQQRNAEKRRQTEKLFNEALRVGKTNADVAAFLMKAGKGKSLLNPVEEETDESDASTNPSIEEDVVPAMNKIPAVTAEVRDDPWNFELVSSSSNENQEVALSCVGGNGSKTTTVEQNEKTVKRLAKKMSKKFPTIPASQIKDLISEALIVANECDASDSVSDDTSNVGSVTLLQPSDKIKSILKASEAKEEIDEAGSVGTRTDFSIVSTKSSSSFRDILRNMRKGRSRNDDDDSTTSLFGSDSSQSRSSLRKLLNDGRSPEESVDYLLEEKRRTENIVMSALKEGKTVREIGEMLTRLEEQRLQDEEKRKAVELDKLNKRRARQLVQKAIDAGAGKSPREIATFLLEREAKKSTEELVAKALKESKTASEVAEYLLKVSGEEKEESSPNTSSPNTSKWKQKMEMFKGGSQRQPFPAGTLAHDHSVAQSNCQQPEKISTVVKETSQRPPSRAGSRAASLDDDYSLALSVHYMEDQESDCYSFAQEAGCLDIGELEERINAIDLDEKIESAKYCAGEAKEYADEVADIVNEITNEVVRGGTYLFGQQASGDAGSLNEGGPPPPPQQQQQQAQEENKVKVSRRRRPFAFVKRRFEC